MRRSGLAAAIAAIAFAAIGATRAHGVLVVEDQLSGFAEVTAITIDRGTGDMFVFDDNPDGNATLYRVSYPDLPGDYAGGGREELFSLGYHPLANGCGIGLTTDNNSTVYFSQAGGIYRLESPYYTPVQVADTGSLNMCSLGNMLVRDSAGNLYAADAGGAVYKYTPPANPANLYDNAGTVYSSGGNEIKGLAIDNNNNLYVAMNNGGVGMVRRLLAADGYNDASGTTFAGIDWAGSITGIAVDSNNHLYATVITQGGRVIAFVAQPDFNTSQNFSHAGFAAVRGLVIERDHVFTFESTTIKRMKALPMITGVSPAGAPEMGGTLTLTVTGKHFDPLENVTDILIGSNSVMADVIYDGDTQFRITQVPPGTGSQHITIVTSDRGESPMVPQDLLIYANPPTVTGLFPRNGTGAGGTSVIISGTNFSNDSVVKFGANTATRTVDGPSQITATSPAGDGIVDVTVSIPGATSATSEDSKFTYFKPVITSVSPAAGPTGGGTSVVIQGSRFDSATSVKFGGVRAVININNSSDLTVEAPAQAAAGTVDVTVTTAEGTGTKAGAFTYADPPTVTAVSPNKGPIAGGTTVTITGTNLAGISDVEFGAANAASFTPINSTSIQAVTPPGISAGAAAIRVVTPGGVHDSSVTFTYFNRPVITAINPNTGPANGGTQVTIVGENLSGVTGVKFGTTASSSFSAASGGASATATAPPHAAGAVNVTLITPGGTSAAANTNKFTYTPTPVATTLIKFAGGVNDGGKPFGGLVADAAGVLYGTTSMGGKFNKGTVFKLTPSGNSFTKTILFHFDGTKGATPYATLAIDGAKTLYGTTIAGGTKNKGVIFKLAGTTYTVLYNFKGDATDGGVPYAGLARHSNGTLYGFTSAGGQKGFGTAFKFTPPSTFAVTHHFNGVTGENPRGTPVLDKNNNVYGAAVTGGAPDQGLVFKIAPNNTRTTLYTFPANGSTGRQPFGALTSPNTNGTMFFGTTFVGGQQNKGAIVDVMPPSTGMLLFSFAGPNGANPYAGPTIDAATTTLFGTTFNGGVQGKGVVYRLNPPANMQPNWTQSVMYAFKGGTADGANPYAGLLRRNNVLYGTTSAGGNAACSNGCGTVFKVVY